MSNSSDGGNKHPIIPFPASHRNPISVFPEALRLGISLRHQGVPGTITAVERMRLPTHRLSLRVRLVLLILIAMLPAIGTIVWTARQQRLEMVRDAGNDCLALARLAATQQGQILEAARQLLVTVANFPPVRAGDAAQCTELFTRLRHDHPQYANLGANHPNGDTWASGLPMRQPVNLADRSWFQRMMQSKTFVVGNYQVGKISGKASVYMGYPILDATGTVREVVYLALDAGWLHRELSRVSMPAEAVMTAVDREGTVLARSFASEQWVGQKLAAQPVVAAMLQQREGPCVLAGLDGVRRLYAFSRVGPGSEGWHLSVGIPVDVLQAGLPQRLWQDLTVVGIVALLALIAAWVLGRATVTQPVRILTDAADRISAGDLTARCATDLPGELGHLAREFNDMAMALQSRNAERDRALEALQESEGRFQNAFENAPIGMALVAPDGRWLRVNRAVCELVGYPAEELLLKTFQDITHPEDLTTDLEYVRQVLDDKIRAYQMQKRYFHKDGHIVWAQLNVSLVRDSRGEPRYFISQIQDVTARVRAEEEIRQLNAELETRVVERTAELTAANRELEAFAYSVSHDLRAPLRAIDGFSQMVVSECGDQLAASARANLEEVRKASQRMGTLIDDLLNLSRITRAEMKRQPVHLSQLAHDIVKQLRQQEPDRQVIVVIADGLTADGDPQLLRVALSNLLGNAWKFTRKASPARIEFGQREGAFFVRDNGAGFDMAYAHKLFGAFQRLHRYNEFEGTGIGLATVQRVVQRHGGRVWADGAIDRGATFYFTV